MPQRWWALRNVASLSHSTVVSDISHIYLHWRSEGPLRLTFQSIDKLILQLKLALIVFNNMDTDLEPWFCVYNNWKGIISYLVWKRR